jgi:hypothetical protein
MIGSDKQIEWATDIRKRMIKTLNKAMSLNSLPKDLPDRDKIFKIRCRQYGQAIFLLEKTNDAIWFIENQDAVKSVEAICNALEVDLVIWPFSLDGLEDVVAQRLD